MPVTAIVRFPLPEGVGRDTVRARFEESVPKYQSVPGLIRKYYQLSEDGRTGGGVYLFASRAAAQALFTAEWRDAVRQRYGAEPDIQYFDTPVIVDNESGKVSTSA